MNKNKIVTVLSLMVTALVLSSCEYQDRFTGSFNNAPSTLNAYSKDTDHYCVSLQWNVGSTNMSSFISANDVFDANHPFDAKTFNTKGEPCSVNLSSYLVGQRITQVLGTDQVFQIERLNQNTCRRVFFKRYHYQDKISFQVIQNTDNQMLGTYNGTGEANTVIDSGHPVGYGPAYFCGNPNPYPQPRPNPGPHPHPRPAFAASFN